MPHTLEEAKRLFPGVAVGLLEQLCRSLHRYDEVHQFALTGRVPEGKARKDYRKSFARRYRLADGKLYHKAKDESCTLLFRTLAEVQKILENV